MALSVHERAEEAGITSKGMAKQLLRYLDDKMTQQAPEQYLVPVSSYLDPDLWRREVDEIFKRKPQVVAFSAEIREPGDYKALDIMGVNLLVTRDDSGVAHVLLNACRHRGVAVVEHGGGSTQRFSCPYHGWTYDNAGKLVHVYREDHFGVVNHAERGLTELASEERGGIIFAVLTPGVSLNLDDWLGEGSVVTEALSLADCHFFSEVSFAGPNWKVTRDGYLEIYHVPFVHRRTVLRFKPPGLPELQHADFYGDHVCVSPTINPSLLDLRNIPEADWKVSQHLNPGYQIFPNFSVIFYPESEGKAAGYEGSLIMLNRIYPGATPEESRTIQTIMTTNALSTDAHRDLAQRFKELMQRTVEGEDYRMAFKAQEGLASGANREFIIGRNEPRLQHFHRTLSKLLGVRC